MTHISKLNINYLALEKIVIEKKLTPNDLILAMQNAYLNHLIGISIDEKDLVAALKKLNEDPISIIEKLKTIGVLKDYKAYKKTKSENEEKRYHIPDLYLYGLKFTRKGTR